APETVPETLPAARRRLRRALSFEVIPPRSATQAERMPQLLRFLDSLSPDYLAVTSSAKSDWLRGTADFIAEVTSTTTLRPLAHLACTAGTESELLAWIDHLLQVGVRGFLAIRGDFPDGETSVPPEHLPHADALVSLLRRVASRTSTCSRPNSATAPISRSPSSSSTPPPTPGWDVAPSTRASPSRSSPASSTSPPSSGCFRWPPSRYCRSRTTLSCASTVTATSPA